MPKRAGSQGRFERRLIGIVAAILAVIVFAYAWFGITESRRDSLRLLVMQGTTFTEALAQAAANAIEAESFYDYLVHRRYDEIVVTLSQMRIDEEASRRLAQAAVQHDLEALYICDIDGDILGSGAVPTWEADLPDWVVSEVRALGENPEANYVLLLEPGTVEQDPLHYYLQISNTLDRILVIVADARYYVEALRQTQIGYLVRNMSREPAVEYIVYQSTEGIIFASRRTGPLLAIESDPFLERALDSDSIMHRRHEFQDKEVLELVRPFATDEYPFGLFRVGLSLERYRAVSNRFDLQMALLSVALFGLLLLGLLYIQGRQKRRELRRRYSDIKSMTDIIFDQMRTGVAVLEDDGTITLVNRAFEGIVGRRDLEERRWEDAVDPPQLSRTNLNRWKAGGEEKEVVITVGGREKVLVVAVSEYRPRAGSTGLVLVVYDITRLKEYERRALRRARLSEMGNLAAGVAHEIRNPLNAISIAAQRLAAEFSPPENAREFKSFTDQIRVETKRLNEIITRFLALAREETRKGETVRLDTLIDEIASFLRLESERLGIELTADVDPGLEIRGDADSLKQVMTNLFNNAKEALDGREGRIHISANRVHDSVVIMFEDSGPGIPRELHEKVFTPYFTTKEAGTGLGLPTVHRIVTDMGGEIHIEESELGGARFVMNLAAADYRPS